MPTEASKDVSMCISNSLALFGCNGSSQFILVRTDELCKLKHDALPRGDGRVAPGWKGSLGGADGGFKLFGGRLWAAGDYLLRGRVYDVHPGGGLGVDKLAIDQQLDIGLWLTTLCVLDSVRRSRDLPGMRLRLPQAARRTHATLTATGLGLPVAEQAWHCHASD